MVGVLVVAGSARSAAQIPEKFENLQHFPRDITRDSLVQVMRGFSFALGVRCEYCHVPRDTAGPPGLNLNYGADDRLAKRRARFMLGMVDSINGHLLPALPQPRRTPIVVSCVTCHRGLAVPATLADILTSIIERFGVDSAVARYRFLRANALESGRYDFSEWSINEMARHLGTAGKTAEAIAMLKLNQEFYPQSTSLDFLIGELHRVRGERDEAIARYRAALQRAPGNTQAQQRLRELGGDR